MRGWRMPIRLLLVDDHEVVRTGLRMLLESAGGVEIVGEAGTARDALEMVSEIRPDVVIMDIGLPDMTGGGGGGPARDALEMVSETRPDVVIMDIGLPDMTGIEAAREIKARRPETSIVALTIHEDQEDFFKMLAAGATGYVPKRAAPEELLTAIEAAAAGEGYLYPSLAKFQVAAWVAPA